MVTNSPTASPFSLVTTFNLGKNGKYSITYQRTTLKVYKPVPGSGSYLDLKLILFVKKFEFYLVTQSLKDGFLFFLNFLKDSYES